MIEWLESHLSTSKSTILMVTHDRYFLEVVCDTIFELAEQIRFLNIRATFLITWKKKPKDRSKCNPPLKKREILSGRSWIGFEDNLKQEEQNKKQEWMLFKEIKKIASQKLDEDELDLPVKMERLGSKIVEFHKIGKAFGELKILKNFSYNVQRKERMGIVGKNGTERLLF